MPDSFKAAARVTPLADVQVHVQGSIWAGRASVKLEPGEEIVLGSLKLRVER